MPRYRFTGTQTTVFPSLLVNENGVSHTVVCDPGTEIDLPDTVDHAELELVEKPKGDAPVAAPAVVEPTPEPAPVEGTVSDAESH